MRTRVIIGAVAAALLLVPAGDARADSSTCQTLGDGASCVFTPTISKGGIFVGYASSGAGSLSISVAASNVYDQVRERYVSFAGVPCRIGPGPTFPLGPAAGTFAADGTSFTAPAPGKGGLSFTDGCRYVLTLDGPVGAIAGEYSGLT